MKRIEGECPGDIEELDDIEAALAPLELRDKGLRSAEPTRQGRLGQTRVLAGLNKKPTELLMLSAERRPRHPASVQSLNGISQMGLSCTRASV